MPRSGGQQGVHEAGVRLLWFGSRGGGAHWSESVRAICCPSGSSLIPGTLGAPSTGRLSTSTVRRSFELRSSSPSRKAEKANTYCSQEPSFRSMRQHMRHTQRLPSTAVPPAHANSGLLRGGCSGVMSGRSGRWFGNKGGSGSWRTVWSRLAAVAPSGWPKPTRVLIATQDGFEASRQPVQGCRPAPRGSGGARRGGCQERVAPARRRSCRSGVRERVLVEHFRPQQLAAHRGGGTKGTLFFQMQLIRT